MCSTGEQGFVIPRIRRILNAGWCDNHMIFNLHPKRFVRLNAAKRTRVAEITEIFFTPNLLLQVNRCQEALSTTSLASLHD